MGKIKEVTVALVFCDICNKQITNIGLGAVVYRDSDADAGRANVLYAHKNQCHNETEEKLGKLDTSWQELSDHIEDIFRFTGVSKEAIYEMALRLDDPF